MQFAATSTAGPAPLPRTNHTPNAQGLPSPKEANPRPSPLTLGAPQSIVPTATNGQPMSRVSLAKRGSQSSPVEEKNLRPASFLDVAEDLFFWLRQTTWNRLSKRFDRVHGTDTGGTKSLKNLGVAGPRARYGIRYQPIDPSVFRQALGIIQGKTTPRETTFVDLGCGKGRALILASALPFREIIGVELAPSLAECARRNLTIARVANGKIVCQSADEFRFPAGDLVVFLFNPFVGPVFRRAIHNLCRTASGNVFLIYVNVTQGSLLGGMRCFRLREAGAVFQIYQHCPHGKDEPAERPPHGSIA
jgi:SAM-dependent methyltransferase